MENKGKERINNIVIPIIVAIVAIAAVLVANIMVTNYSEKISEEASEQNQIMDLNVDTAVVKEIIAVNIVSPSEFVQVTEVIFTAEITSGENEGKIIEMTQSIDELYLPIPDQVEVGDAILVSDSELVVGASSTTDWYYTGENKIAQVAILIGIFVLLILIIGRLKGVAAVTSLAITIGAIFLVYVPLILTGFNIYVATIIIMLFIIFSNLLILNGFNTKSLCAILGNSFGILVAGIVAFSVNTWLGISGVVDQDYIFLTMLENGVSLDLIALVWSAILIGSLGAVMDVAMSISSSLTELAEQMEVRSFKQLVRSGMNIGRDMIGTMTNTLILAYVGSSLAVILLFVANNRNMLIILNLEMIIVEVIQAVVGSIGILVAVPLTVLVGASIYTKKNSKSAVQIPITSDVQEEITEEIE